MRELYVIILFLGVISHGVYFFINKFIATLDVSDYILEGTRNITHIWVILWLGYHALETQPRKVMYRGIGIFGDWRGISEGIIWRWARRRYLRTGGINSRGV